MSDHAWDIVVTRDADEWEELCYWHKDYKTLRLGTNGEWKARIRHVDEIIYLDDVFEGVLDQIAPGSKVRVRLTAEIVPL